MQRRKTDDTHPHSRTTCFELVRRGTTCPVTRAQVCVASLQGPRPQSSPEKRPKARKGKGSLHISPALRTNGLPEVGTETCTNVS